MQPFDALTIKVVLAEAKPLLLNKKVDKVQQVARDEIVLSLHSRTGVSRLLLSAHASFGRICLVNMPPRSRRSNPPGFCMLLRKYLVGSTLVGAEQIPGERIVDIFFSCPDELGAPSHKVLTAEIMGRHSNLIFWDKSSQQILGASHVVTRDMSRQREVAAGLAYARPPAQDKKNIFKIAQEEFAQAYSQRPPDSFEASCEQWLVSSFAGLGRHLAEEIVAAAESAGPGTTGDGMREEIWRRLEALAGDVKSQPAMRTDLTRFTVVSWWPDLADESAWKRFPSANDMVEGYFRQHEDRERFQHLKDRLQAELRQEADRLHGRLDSAAKYLEGAAEQADYKKFGDLILAHISEIRTGAAELNCEDLLEGNGHRITVPLNPNLSASQNAQHYYRQFAKVRARRSAVGSARDEAGARLAVVEDRMAQVDSAATVEDLEKLKETILPARIAHEAGRPAVSAKPKARHRLLSVTSSDGWTIYMGRNRQENDELISRLAQPQDIWMHILGQGGAHVLIKVPSTGREPPASTLQEAAQAAARLSKAVTGGKVRVVYTQCRHVRKAGKNKPGVVRYENEKTLEVDTARPMPEPLKRLFAGKARRQQSCGKIL